MKFLKPTFLTALLALIVNTVYAGCKARASFTQNGNTVIFYDDSSSSQYGYGINSMLKSYDQLPQTKAIQFGVEYKIR